MITTTSRPAPSDPRAEVVVSLVPAHLGSVTGGGTYEAGATATLVATCFG